ncbi:MULTISPECIES: MEDS domain-containing protein [Rhizobium]|uniref:MEDS domain-containing protein n=1 Tax=Rhizobium favelukesii TaxID=348824 RepID=W6S933_9HYPH|nr:hypothetical protein LPU83_pLPU83d_1271 [Rhizobium favelukesii]
MNRPPAHIRFGGCELTRSRHVCAFFNSPDEAYKSSMSFISEGFACGHKAVHFVNPGSIGSHLERLQCEGVDKGSRGGASEMDE